MKLNKIKPRFYIYGCDQFLHDLEELVHSAGDYQESGRTTDDWLDDLGLGFDSKPESVRLSWGSAINIAIKHTTRRLVSIRDESNDDFPF